MHVNREEWSRKTKEWGQPSRQAGQAGVCGCFGDSLMWTGHVYRQHTLPTALVAVAYR